MNKMNNDVFYGEYGYVKLVDHILRNGVDVPDRTGVGSRAIFDAKVIYDEKTFPFSTIKPAATRPAFEEFWFFMRGETQTKKLEEKGINFWVGNTTREFLDKRGLNALDEGDMGLAYGSQWRGFNRLLVDEENEFDQLTDAYEVLKNDPYSRRVYTTFWNPSASKYMALTPCWHSHQFVMLPGTDGKDHLHLKLVNRSLDSIFGFSFAVQQYRLYQMAMAKALGVEVGRMSCDLTQIHIYRNQIEYAKEMVTRDLPFIDNSINEISINKELNSLTDILDLEWDDIFISDYVQRSVNRTPFVAKRPEMAI